MENKKIVHCSAWAIYYLSKNNSKFGPIPGNSRICDLVVVTDKSSLIDVWVSESNLNVFDLVTCKNCLKEIIYWLEKRVNKAP